MRRTNIRRAVLDILECASPLAEPEGQLLLELNGRMRPPAGMAECDEEILFLQSRGFIARVPDALDDSLVKWCITEAGKAMLRQ